MLNHRLIYNNNIHKLLNVIGSSTIISNEEKNQLMDVLTYFNVKHGTYSRSKNEDEIKRLRQAEKLRHDFITKTWPDKPDYYFYDEKENILARVGYAFDEGYFYYWTLNKEVGTVILKTTYKTVKTMGFWWDENIEKFRKDRTLSDLSFEDLCKLLQNAFDTDIKIKIAQGL